MRLRAAAQMSRLAGRLADAEMRFHAHRLRFMDLLESGDSVALAQEFDLCEQLATQLRQPYYGWYVETFRAQRAFLDGRFDDCERLARQAADLGQRAQNQNVMQILGIQTFAVRREQGRLAGLADVCAILRDRERAPALYRLLKPFAALNASLAPGTACNGSVARVLGRLSTTLCAGDRASRHFDAALEANHRLGAPQFVAHTQAQLGEMLLLRGRAGDAAATYRRRGMQPAAQRAATHAVPEGQWGAASPHSSRRRASRPQP